MHTYGFLLRRCIFNRRAKDTPWGSHDRVSIVWGFFNANPHHTPPRQRILTKQPPPHSAENRVYSTASSVAPEAPPRVLS